MSTVGYKPWIGNWMSTVGYEPWIGNWMSTVGYEPWIGNWMSTVGYEPRIGGRVGTIRSEPRCRAGFCSGGIRDVGANGGAYEQECERKQNGELDRTHEPSSEISSGPGDENSRCWKTHEWSKGKCEKEKEMRRNQEWLEFQPEQ